MNDLVAALAPFMETGALGAPYILKWLQNAEACLQAVRRKDFCAQLADEVRLNKINLEAANVTIDELLNASLLAYKSSEYQGLKAHIQKNLEELRSRARFLSKELEDLIDTSAVNAKENELFLNKNIERIPTGAPFISSLESQLRKDLWRDQDGVAVFSKISKSNPQNYIEHYI
ncbi:hypothetical protein [Leptolyngbya sp. FACHB-261]|uniref:hypothetical protein n=1 Tax=Leptolyngbya sp. FACHB-261 TaxID=2692806 RepID=UPI001686E0EB|nr:hypothetical protein [Leptolyngbya sp. FACHB-261]